MHSVVPLMLAEEVEEVSDDDDDESDDEVDDEPDVVRFATFAPSASSSEAVGHDPADEEVPPMLVAESGAGSLGGTSDADAARRGICSTRLT
jgi:hypothetical protein